MLEKVLVAQQCTNCRHSMCFGPSYVCSDGCDAPYALRLRKELYVKNLQIDRMNELILGYRNKFGPMDNDY